MAEVDTLRAQLRRGEFAPVLDRGPRLLERVERRFGPDSGPVMDVLDMVVEAAWKSGRGHELEIKAMAERAWSLRLASSGIDSPEAIPAAANLAVVRFYSGDIQGALPLMRQLVVLRERALGPDHPQLAAALNNLGEGHRELGHLDSAEVCHARALAIREKSLGAEHPLTAWSLNNLANVHTQRASYEVAVPLYARSLAIREKLLGPDHLDVAISLNNLGEVYREMGQPDSARLMHERALTIREHAFGPEHPMTAHSTNNVGIVLYQLGDTLAAETLILRALRIREQVLGGSHLDVSHSLNNAAQLAIDRGNLEDGRRLHQRALIIREQSLGPEHPMVAWSLENLGAVWAMLGEQDSAGAALRRSLVIRERALGPWHPVTAASLGSLASDHLRWDRPDSAIVYYQRAYEVMARALGREHPDVARMRYGLAVAWTKTGRLDSARVAALDAEDIGRRHLRRVLQSLPEREALRYAAIRPPGLALAIGIVSRPDAPRAWARSAWDALIRSRALVLDEMVRRNRAIRASSDPGLASLHAEYVSAQARFSRLALRHDDATAAMLPAARTRADSLERLLALESDAYREGEQQVGVGFDETIALIPRTTTAVSYGTGIRPDDPDSGGMIYVAFVKPADQEPVAIALGSVTGVDSVARRWLDRVRVPPYGSESSAQTAAIRREGLILRNWIWEPVRKRLRRPELILVVPDGVIALLPLGALPSDRVDRFLIEDHPPLHYLSAERDLATQSEEVGRGLLALGGADFDEPSALDGPASPTEAYLANNLVTRGSRGMDAPLAARRWKPLPETLMEVETIEQQWRRQRPAEAASIEVLVGAAASEAAFKQRARGRNVLHLATHGFFVDGGAPPAMATRGIGGFSTVESEATPAPAAPPLIRSGLVLAGANRGLEARDASEDGILTAEEVASLDLKGVECAVLSACETGLGSIHSGEGVLGLRRAFQLAGAQSVVISMWNVEDAATREWMERFYAARLQDRLTSADAVQSATLHTLKQSRTRGVRGSPFLWGAFVAVGNGR